MLMSSSILTILDLKNVKNVTLKYAKIFSSVLSGVGGSADDCLGLVDLLMTGGAAVCALMLSQLPL